MSKITLTEKRQIGRLIRQEYTRMNPRNVRFGEDGGITVMVDQMPNTNEPGRIFIGWDTDWLRAVKELAD